MDLSSFRVLPLLLGIPSLCGFSIAAGSLPSSDQIIAAVTKRAEVQDNQLRDYSVMRRYTLRNHHMDGDASLTVELEYQAGHGKQFSIVRTVGAGIAQHALLTLVRDEEKNSERNPSWNAINRSNYWFTLLGEEEHDGRQCYHFKIAPRETNRLLLDGELWVDTVDLAVVAIKGRPSKNLSFWLGRPSIEQHFAPVNGFWMPSANQTTAQVRLAGDTELHIEYWGYKFNVPILSLKRP